MIINNYIIKDIENYEEFINTLFSNLKHYENINNNFSFKIVQGKDYIELKTLDMNESAN